MTTQLRIRHVLVAATMAAGCSSASTDDGGPAPDLKPGPDLASGADAADAASGACPSPANLMTTNGTCNLVPFPTTRVPFTVQTSTAPTFNGGQLVDGIYTAIKAEGWNVTTGYGRQMGIVIGNGGTTMLWFGQTLNADGSGDVDAGTAGLFWLRANFDLSIASQNTLALSETCAAGTTSGPATLLYTATTTGPPQLILANPAAANPTSAVTTYERQGCPPAS
jgi:hypothetical protein